MLRPEHGNWSLRPPRHTTGARPASSRTRAPRMLRAGHLRPQAVTSSGQGTPISGLGSHRLHSNAFYYQYLKVRGSQPERHCHKLSAEAMLLKTQISHSFCCRMTASASRGESKRITTSQNAQGPQNLKTVVDARRSRHRVFRVQGPGWGPLLLSAVRSSTRKTPGSHKNAKRWVELRPCALVTSKQASGQPH